MRAVACAAVLVALAGAPAAAPAARAETIPLGWSERHSEFAGHVVLTYEVRTLTRT